VLLILHGGPGSTWDPLSRLFVPWQQFYTLVEWDQRGAGRTYARNRKDETPITLDRMVHDGIEVADYVSQHLHQRKVLLLGHSWGTLLGVEMTQIRPELFLAYVGTGQIVNTRKSEALGYAEVLRRAGHAHNPTAVKDLNAIGAPPYDDVQKLGIERQWETIFAAASEQKFNSIGYVRTLFPPDFTDQDLADRNAGFFASNYSIYGQKMDGWMLAVDLPASAREFQMPMFFIQGELDDITPTSLVKDYVRQITAPRKDLVVLPGEGHLAVMANPELFLKDLRALLDPILKKGAAQ
jgi:pimeloyl-ACP methyl ester carboxylesterase